MNDQVQWCPWNPTIGIKFICALKVVLGLYFHGLTRKPEKTNVLNLKCNCNNKPGGKRIGKYNSIKEDAGSMTKVSTLIYVIWSYNTVFIVTKTITSYLTYVKIPRVCGKSRLNHISLSKYKLGLIG